MRGYIWLSSSQWNEHANVSPQSSLVERCTDVFASLRLILPFYRLRRLNERFGYLLCIDLQESAFHFGLVFALTDIALQPRIIFLAF